MRFHYKDLSRNTLLLLWSSEQKDFSNILKVQSSQYMRKKPNFKKTTKPLGNILPPKPVRYYQDQLAKSKDLCDQCFIPLFFWKNIQYSQKYLTQLLQNKLQTNVPIKVSHFHRSMILLFEYFLLSAYQHCCHLGKSQLHSLLCFPTSEKK